MVDAVQNPDAPVVRFLTHTLPEERLSLEYLERQLQEQRQALITAAENGTLRPNMLADYLRFYAARCDRHIKELSGSPDETETSKRKKQRTWEKIQALTILTKLNFCRLNGTLALIFPDERINMTTECAAFVLGRSSTLGNWRQNVFAQAIAPFFGVQGGDLPSY